MTDPRPGGTRHPRLLRVLSRGRISYGEGVRLQEDLVRRRRAGEIPDTLVLLEHPHVITLGSGAGSEHVLVDEEERRRRGMELHESGRGGDVTYHGPGQLVGYPILDLKPDRRDLHRYLRDLEEVLIRALARFGLSAARSPGLTGVWIGRRKVAALGVRVSSGWITSHGFALNVDPDLSFFETIVPCGIPDREVTSLRREVGRAPEDGVVRSAVVKAFGEVFERDVDVPWTTALAGAGPG